MTKRIGISLWLLVAAAWITPCFAAGDDDYRKQVIEHWMRGIRVSNDKTGSGVAPEQDAAGAVNGDRFDKGSGFHTQADRDAWWQVDLGKVYPIGKIIVANRPSAEGRAKKLEILFSSDETKWDLAYTHNGKTFFGGTKGTEPLTVSFAGKPARYVRMQLHNEFLHLNEVEVYALGDDRTNVALRKFATQSSTSPQSSDHGDANAPKLAVRVGKKDIEDVLALTERTLGYVTKAKPLPEQAKQFNAMQQQWTSGAVRSSQYDSFYIQVRTLRRNIIFSHPALDIEKILINRNPPTKYSHNGDQHLGIHSRVGPGLTMLTNWKVNPRTTTILAGKLPVGATRNPDLNYDADKVVFAYCDQSGPDSLRKRFFLYEAAIDGSWVRQLTGTERDNLATWHNRATVVVEDNDPCYLPDGEIVFISTRSQSFGRCHGGRYNPAWVLYKCDNNGDNIHQLSYGNENEYEPAVLNDGRIIFTRWEYTNRHEMLFHKLWTCRPDGTSVAHYYGNDTLAPMEVLESTAIPGTDKIVATAQGHHSYNTGTTVIVDTTFEDNGETPITHVTPETPYSETYGWPSPHFSHPYPVNEELFFVSRANHKIPPQGHTPPVNDRAIYLVDTLGGRELIFEDPNVASFSPIAIRKRVRPPVIPPMTPADAPDFGTVYVQNAYLTRNDPEKKIQPGTIKAIRVNAIGVQPRAHRSPCSMTVPVEIPKKVLGTVPVNADGSAYFKVPAGVSLQLQILDQNGMAVLTEKSFFYMQPGETRSCVGCHEPLGASPGKVDHRKYGKLPLMDLTPPAGPQYKGGLSFMRTVQPVLDRYCIGCHGLDKVEKGNVSLVHDGKMTWPRSLEELVNRGEHRVGLKSYTNDALKNFGRAYTFYSFGSKIPPMLLKNHGNTNIDKASFQRIIDWLDLNAQCYGDLFPNKVEERKFDAKALVELRAYARQLFGDKIAAQPERALVNPAQPDESRILMAPLSLAAGGWGQMPNGWKTKDDPGYKKMAELVNKCIVKNPNENDNGWEPAFNQGGGEDWIVKDRTDFLQRLKLQKKGPAGVPVTIAQ